ncbi:helix-turn-helix domain-containing protein [Streptomyces europaeiscabiei]|uniref:helix-turn-helix domain-containing protein n=1 Tax=Streptomyces europaeiscabiei TaxID=146819 RepID=UPI003CC64AE8
MRRARLSTRGRDGLPRAPPGAQPLAVAGGQSPVRLPGRRQVGVLTHAAFDGVEALVRISAAAGEVPETNRALRGRIDEGWAEGERRLRDRGMLDSPGGRAARAAVEALTDLFASAPWKALGARSAHRPLGG